MRSTISNGLRLMLMLNVPATIGLIVLAAPIVALIFEHGRFNGVGHRRDGGRARVLRARTESATPP